VYNTVKGKDMPLTLEVKLVKLGNSVRMTVPVEVLRALKWSPGDIVQIGIDDSTTMSVKKKNK
jgi:antitoxin component of MazEF toxin-antitoxin module